VIVPSAGYLSGAAALCRRHRVLLIADEAHAMQVSTPPFDI
jgi:acetylornithine/succinyldiaminopimelate/putrescine aminotransferase